MNYLILIFIYTETSKHIMDIELVFFQNMIFMGFISYEKLTKKLIIIKSFNALSIKKISVLIKNSNVESYFSPLKMFDYMAAGKIIIASDLKVYKHILKQNKLNINQS